MKHRTIVIGCVATLLAAASLPACAGSIYYVDTRGADRNPGSERRPLRTIGRAVTRAQPGDLVVVRKGTYRESVKLDASGTPDAPIVVRGLPGAVMTSPDPSASLSAFDINGASFLTVQGFEMSGGFAETVFVRPGSHDVELAGLHVHDNHTGIWIAGATDVTVRDSVVEHNYRTGVRIFAGASRVRVMDTRSEANDDGLGCNGDSDGFNADASTSDVWFERVSALGNSEDGLDLQGPNMTLLQVTAQDNGCSGVKIAAGGYLENVLAERSRIGLNVNGPAGASTVVANCTLAQNDIGVRVSGSAHTVTLRNSVISGPAKAISYPANVNLLESFNLLYRPSLGDRLIVRVEPDGETTYSGDDINSGRWQRASGQGDDTMARDPRFEPDGCRPSAGSAAVDSGDDVGAAPIDLTGMPRPSGAAVDRGAFEWVPATAPLRVQRAALRANGAGTGAVRLHAEVDLPADTTFNPRTDAVTIALRGTRGDVVRVDAPAGRRRARMAGQTILSISQHDASGRSARVLVRLSGHRATLDLSAGGVDAWVLDAQGAQLNVQLGHLYATAPVVLSGAPRH